MSSTCPFWGTTAYENELGCQRRRRMRSSALVEPESPRMSLTLDAVEKQRTVAFSSERRELRELVVWLQEFDVEHVAMESTGVYWKPV